MEFSIGMDIYIATGTRTKSMGGVAARVGTRREINFQHIHTLTAHSTPAFFTP